MQPSWEPIIPSNLSVKSYGASKWLGLVLVVGFAVSAYATPIQPNLKKLLDRAQQPAPTLPAARAGWYGPEKMPAEISPALQQISPAAEAARARQGLLTAAIPKPWAIASFILLIFGLRFLRRLRWLPVSRVIEFPAPIPSASDTKAA